MGAVETHGDWSPLSWRLVTTPEGRTIRSSLQDYSFGDNPMTTIKLHETVADLHPERPLLVSTLLLSMLALRFLPFLWFGCARLLLPPHPPVMAHRGARVPARGGWADRRVVAGALRLLLVACCSLSTCRDQLSL